MGGTEICALDPLMTLQALTQYGFFLLLVALLVKPLYIIPARQRFLPWFGF